MSSRIYVTDFTVPAQTPIATPVLQPVVLDDAQLDQVRIILPPGMAALAGLAITSGGGNVAPYIQGSWITGDDEQIDYPYNAEITANGIVLAGYNLDLFQHTFHLRWFVSDRQAGSPVVIASPQAAAAVPVDTAQTIAGLTGTADSSAGLTADDLAALNAAQLSLTAGP